RPRTPGKKPSRRSRTPRSRRSATRSSGFTPISPTKAPTASTARPTRRRSASTAPSPARRSPGYPRLDQLLRRIEKPNPRSSQEDQALLEMHALEQRVKARVGADRIPLRVRFQTENTLVPRFDGPIEP